jgi:hypothetical protein
MPLDRAKLYNVKPCDGGWTAGCPVCGRDGRDQSKNHLKLWHSGAYSCAVHPGDDAHNKTIFAIAGIGGSGEPDTLVEAAPSRQIELPKFWPVDVLDGLVKDHSYWNGRGISDFTVAPFRGGVATQHQMKGRYVFPIFDPLNEDKVIGFSGRLIAPTDNPAIPSWKHIGAKSLFIWGDPDECESTHRIILVESIGDLLMLREHGVQDVLCLFGVTLSQVLLAKIIAINPSSIIISTNRDSKHTAGQDAAAKITKTLSKFFEESVIQTVLPPEREGLKDWGQIGLKHPEDIKAAFLSDKA